MFTLAFDCLVLMLLYKMYLSVIKCMYQPCIVQYGAVTAVINAFKLQLKYCTLACIITQCALQCLSGMLGWISAKNHTIAVWEATGPNIWFENSVTFHSRMHSTDSSMSLQYVVTVCFPRYYSNLGKVKVAVPLMCSAAMHCSTVAMPQSMCLFCILTWYAPHSSTVLCELIISASIKKMSKKQI